MIEVSSAAFLPATQDKNRVTGLVDAGNQVGEGSSSRHYLNERSLFAEDADLETEFKVAIGEGIVVISSMAGKAAIREKHSRRCTPPC